MSRPDLQARLREVASRVALDYGVELVDLVFRYGAGRTLVRLDIDRPGPQGATLEDCQRVSHAVGVAFEAEDVILASYVLEVSSPGLDRPIKTADDIRRNTGRRIVVETSEPIAGSRSFRGVLLGSEGGSLKLLADGEQEIRIPLAGVVRARQEVKF